MNKGLIIKIYDNSNNLVNKFSSIKKTAEHFDVSVRFIRKYIDNNEKFKGFIFKSELKNNKVGVYDPKYKLIDVLNNSNKVSDLYDIPYTTLRRYIKTGKLYKDKYYFCRVLKPGAVK